MKSGSSFGLLRVVSLIVLVAGAAGSLDMVFRVGHRNPSHLLMGLFVVWVSSPFVALVVANLYSKRWSIPSLVVALGSLAVYMDVALGPPRSQPAFVFLVVPLVSWTV